MKARTGFFLLAFSLFKGYGLAQDAVSPAGARSLGMSGVHVMLSGPSSGTGNPAGLASVPTPALSLHYSDLFLIPGLGSGSFSAVLPTPSGNFGAGLSVFGNSYYHENHACLSFGKSFGTWFMAGIGLHYLHIHQPASFGTLHALVPALGIQVMPLPGMIIGVHVFNPANQQYHPVGYSRLPAVMHVGLGYQLGDEVTICAEVMKKSKESLKCYGGVEIGWKQTFFTRFGIFSGTYPGFSLGLGFRFRPLLVDIGAKHHPVLGFSPAITITLAAESGKKNIRKHANQTFSE